MLEQHDSSRSTRSSRLARLARLARQSRTCRVESNRVEPSGIWAYVAIKVNHPVWEDGNIAIPTVIFLGNASPISSWLTPIFVNCQLLPESGGLWKERMLYRSSDVELTSARITIADR